MDWKKLANEAAAAEALKQPGAADHSDEAGEPR